jgi:phosphoribosyl 1,2-cyclic phosphodiesterase
VLGSGSGGNSTVVKAPWGVFLVDAGFGPRATAERLSGTGIGVEDISAIVLTHLDTDHWNCNWLQTVVKRGIRIFMAGRKVKGFLGMPEVREVGMKLAARKFVVTKGIEELVTGFEEEGEGLYEGQPAVGFEPVKGVRMEAIRLAHDEAGSHGFVLVCDGYKVGFATDLGQVPDTLIRKFCGADVLAIESNYDVEMERNSTRPYYLKARIMGGSGHLSNEQAFAAVVEILDRTEKECGVDQLPRHVVLLHRSRECNCPKLVERLFTRDARIGSVLTLAHQHERTGWLSARRGRAMKVEQMAMAWG